MNGSYTVEDGAVLPSTSNSSGSVLRDLLRNHVPPLFCSELYASVSVVVGIVYVGGVRWQIDYDLVVRVTLAIGLTLRLPAIAFNWEMPKFVYDAELH